MDQTLTQRRRGKRGALKAKRQAAREGRSGDPQTDCRMLEMTRITAARITSKGPRQLRTRGSETRTDAAPTQSSGNSCG